jgi:hypothetical protein
MDGTTVTLLVGLGTAGGAFIGIVIGQYLTRSWERVQSIATAKKEECREVLKALSHCTITFLRSNTEAYKTADQVKREQDDAAAESLRAIWSCMFIAEELDALGIAPKWMELIEAYPKDHDRTKFANGAYALTLSVASMGVRSAQEKTSLEQMIELTFKDYTQY